MEISQFLGLKKYYEKRLDADLHLLDDAIIELEAKLNGYKGLLQKPNFTAKGMLQKLLGSVWQMKKISSEVLTLNGQGNPSGIEIMEELRKDEKAQRIRAKFKGRKKGQRRQISAQKQP